MKKKLLTVVILSTLFAGTVSASSINGEYKGNSIVKVKSNGQVLSAEDTPAIIYDDRTMIPIYMLKQLGANVIWDESTFSVNVTLPTDIKKIKMYMKIANHYKNLLNLGDMIRGISVVQGQAYEAITKNYKALDSVNRANTRLNEIIKSYNNMIDLNNDISLEANYSSINIEDTKTILTNYFNAIDYYKESDKAIGNFYNNQTDANFYDYLNNSGKGFDAAMSASEDSTKKYFEFYNKTQQ